MKAQFNAQIEKLNHELEFYKQPASNAATEDRDKDSETPTDIVHCKDVVGKNGGKSRRNSSKVT